MELSLNFLMVSVPTVAAYLRVLRGRAATVW